jgi:hypothetical protein
MSAHLGGQCQHSVDDPPITSPAEVKAAFEDTVARGRAAWQRIKQTQRRLFDDWLQVGEALVAGRAWSIGKSEAEAATATDHRLGRGYNTLFSQWLKDNGFDNDEHDRLHDAVRGALFAIMDNLDAVRAWRDTLDDDKQRAWNSPTTVWRHYQEHLASLKPPEPEAQPAAARSDTAVDTVTQDAKPAPASTKEPQPEPDITVPPSDADDDADTDDDAYDEGFDQGFDQGYNIGYAVGYHTAARAHGNRPKMREVIKSIANHTELSVTEVERLLVDHSGYLEGLIGRYVKNLGFSDAKIATEVGLPVKLVREVIERDEELQREAEARPEKDAPATPPWCKSGKLEERAALLLQAIETAGWKGLGKYDDINPFELSDAARERGIAALIALKVPTSSNPEPPVIEAGDRVYLRRFAPRYAPTVG